MQMHTIMLYDKDNSQCISRRFRTQGPHRRPLLWHHVLSQLLSLFWPMTQHQESTYVYQGQRAVALPRFCCWCASRPPCLRTAAASCPPVGLVQGLGRLGGLRTMAGRPWQCLRARRRPPLCPQSTHSPLDSLTSSADTPSSAFTSTLPSALASSLPTSSPSLVSSMLAPAAAVFRARLRLRTLLQPPRCQPWMHAYRAAHSPYLTITRRIDETSHAWSPHRC